MIVGFTGTSKGMTEEQRLALVNLFARLQIHVLHHGVCVGADAQAHRIAQAFKAYIVGHPPVDYKKMATLTGFDELRPPKAYLFRNRAIVEEGIHGLVAAPASMNEPANLRGQGTWTTVGYARKAKRCLWIVRPDGSVAEETGVLPDTNAPSLFC